ncbi:hypothetical protein ACM66B_005604 [Microbotryomycetes sp. NB124-2]
MMVVPIHMHDSHHAHHSSGSPRYDLPPVSSDSRATWSSPPVPPSSCPGSTMSMLLNDDPTSTLSIAPERIFASRPRHRPPTVRSISQPETVIRRASMDPSVFTTVSSSTDAKSAHTSPQLQPNAWSLGSGHLRRPSLPLQQYRRTSLEPTPEVYARMYDTLAAKWTCQANDLAESQQRRRVSQVAKEETMPKENVEPSADAEQDKEDKEDLFIVRKRQHDDSEQSSEQTRRRRRSSLAKFVSSTHAGFAESNVRQAPPTSGGSSTMSPSSSNCGASPVAASSPRSPARAPSPAVVTGDRALRRSDRKRKPSERARSSEVVRSASTPSPASAQQPESAIDATATDSPIEVVPRRASSSSEALVNVIKSFEVVLQYRAQGWRMLGDHHHFQQPQPQ